MIERILLSPPGAFILLVLLLSAAAVIFSKMASIKRQNRYEAEQPYACGEDYDEHMIQPDYSQFFPYAFFFTILHVVALVIATVPRETAGVFSIAVVYIISAIIGLLILMRK